MPKLNLELPSYIDHTSSEDKLDIEKAVVPPELQPMIGLKEPSQPEYDSQQLDCQKENNTSTICDEYISNVISQKPNSNSNKGGKKISKVWEHFLQDVNNRSNCVCQYCFKVIASNNGSTSGMKKHLLTKHDIVLGFTEKAKINHLLKYLTKSTKPEHLNKTKRNWSSKAKWLCKTCDQPVLYDYVAFLLHLRNGVNNVKWPNLKYLCV